MKKNKIPFFVIISAGLIFYSCSKENEEDLSKGIVTDNCKANEATYESIKPIFSAHCVSCHNTNDFQKNVKLDTYEGVRDASGKKLLMAIKHETGAVPMPYLAEKLDSCQIAMIESWINRNFPQ